MAPFPLLCSGPPWMVFARKQLQAASPSPSPCPTQQILSLSWLKQWMLGSCRATVWNWRAPFFLLDRLPVWCFPKILCFLLPMFYRTNWKWECKRADFVVSGLTWEFQPGGIRHRQPDPQAKVQAEYFIVLCLHYRNLPGLLASSWEQTDKAPLNLGRGAAQGLLRLYSDSRLPACLIPPPAWLAAS